MRRPLLRFLGANTGVEGGGGIIISECCPRKHSLERGLYNVDISLGNPIQISIHPHSMVVRGIIIIILIEY